MAIFNSYVNVYQRVNGIFTINTAFLEGVLIGKVDPKIRGFVTSSPKNCLLDLSLIVILSFHHLLTMYRRLKTVVNQLVTTSLDSTNR